MEEVGDSAGGSDLRVGPQTSVFWGDASVGQDRGGFDYYEGGPAIGECGEMDEVEVGEAAVLC